jgi:hypothetical protein
MSDGFFFLYRSDWRPDTAAAFLRTVDSGGLMLTNPATRRVSWITNGPDTWGEQVFVTEPVLVERLTLPAGTDEVNFQLWLDGDNDVFTRVRRVDSDLVALEFSLDGLTSDEQDRVVAGLQQTLESHRAGTVGFVVDRSGASEDVDWDDVMAGGATVVAPFPDAFGISVNCVAVHAELRSLPPVVRGDLAVFGHI